MTFDYKKEYKEFYMPKGKPWRTAPGKELFMDDYEIIMIILTVIGLIIMSHKNKKNEVAIL